MRLFTTEIIPVVSIMPSPSMSVAPVVISLDKLKSLGEEREGLMEAIICLQGYCEEVYKDGILPPGLKICIDKLGDKLKLVEEEIKYITPA